MAQEIEDLRTKSEAQAVKDAAQAVRKCASVSIKPTNVPYPSLTSFLSMRFLRCPQRISGKEIAASAAIRKDPMRNLDIVCTCPGSLRRYPRSERWQKFPLNRKGPT